MSNPHDSAAVAALKQRIEILRGDKTDWAAHTRKLLASRIRSQRLSEARAKGVHTAKQWGEIVARFESRCVQCGCFPEGGPCKDHIVPIYLGGSDGADNLQPLCRECNTAKGPNATNWAAYRDEYGFGDVDPSFEDEAF